MLSIIMFQGAYLISVTQFHFSELKESISLIPENINPAQHNTKSANKLDWHKVQFMDVIFATMKIDITLRYIDFQTLFKIISRWKFVEYVLTARFPGVWSMVVNFLSRDFIDVAVSHVTVTIPEALYSSCFIYFII